MERDAATDKTARTEKSGLCIEAQIVESIQTHKSIHPPWFRWEPSQWRRRRLLPITQTSLMAIAALQIMGFRRTPNAG